MEYCSCKTRKLDQLLLVFWLQGLAAMFSQAAVTISPNCQSKCGDLTVPYPFGIGTNCSLNPWFDITCKTTPPSSPPEAFVSLRHGNVRVYDISDSQLRVGNSIAKRCYNRVGYIVESNAVRFDLTNSPYTFSDSNKFTVVGCNDYAVINGDEYGHRLSTGCLSLCPDAKDVVSGNCSGIGCCQTSIPKGHRYYNTHPAQFWGDTSTRSFDPCSYAFLGEGEKFTFRGPSDFTDPGFVNRTLANVPVVLDWAIGSLSCVDARNSNALLCQSNSTCVDSDTSFSTGGYRCRCSIGYDGNPYLPPGCQDINECEDPTNNLCEGICVNTPGSYQCSCPKGYIGDGWKNGSRCSCPHGYIDYGRHKGRGCVAHRSRFLVLEFSIGIAICVILVLLGITWICCFMKKKRMTLSKQIREQFSEQNGGTILKQKTRAKGSAGADEAVKVFRVEVLEKATENYSENRIVGRGRYGTVYKGILPDKHVVAVNKYSKALDGSTDQKEHFVNELIVLARINHRNVVKLLGCCLEDEVPILVYEFIPNNSLFHHIQSKPGGRYWLSWDNRLRIAQESAAALAYLQSLSSMAPIVHGDVKSNKILLDDNYAAKISFGASRLIVPFDDHSQIVQRTFGYLDPEYFCTRRLTEKSDVYSFGVVLAELLTGQRPLCCGDHENSTIDDERNYLAAYFAVSMEQNCLFEILEPRLLREVTFDRLQAAAELTKRCLSGKGKDRPTMNEVAMELECLRKFISRSHQWDHGRHDQEIKIFMPEINDESDLYTAPQSPYNNSFGERSSNSPFISLQIRSP